jgi:penicillin-binding protein-related factor A (putative recombinase)
MKFGRKRRSEHRRLWSQFENRIMEESKYFRIGCVQVPSGVRISGAKTFRFKTKFDFAAGVKGKAVFFDAKTCGEDAFNFKSLAIRDKKKHQFDSLVEIREFGNQAGYLIWFYKHRIIAWADVAVIKTMIEEGKKSVAYNDSGLRYKSDDLPIDLEDFVFGNRI